MSSHEIPGDKSRIDRSFEVIGEYNSAVLQRIANDPSSGLVNKYFASCMDTSAIESLGSNPVTDIWNQFRGLSGGDRASQVASTLAILMKNGFSGLYNFGTDIDAYNPSTMVYVFNQGGLGLPDRSYYEDAAIFKQYIEHIAHMINLVGSFSAAIDAPKIANFEAQLANITVPSDQLFNPFTATNRMQWSDLIRLAPNVGFDKLVDNLQLSNGVAVTIDAPAYFSALSNLIAKTDSQTLALYFQWQVLHQSASRLSSQFVKENFDFYGRVLSGTTTPSPRSKTCMTSTVTVVPELAGKLYAQQAFPASSKTAAEEMYDAILSAFEINVQKLDWMDPVTLDRAIAKLKQILRLIGYPEKPRNYSEYTFNAGYSANWLLAAQSEFNRTLAAAGGPSDRTHWEMGTLYLNIQRCKMTFNFLTRNFFNFLALPDLQTDFLSTLSCFSCF